MRVAVYGPWKRAGLIVDDKIVDLQHGCASFLSEIDGEPRPYEMADALVGHDLRGFLSGGERAVKTASSLLVFAKSKLSGDDWKGLEGEEVAHNISTAKLHPPLVDSSSAKVMCIGGNFSDHLSGMLSRTRNTKITVEDAVKIGRETLAWGFYKLGSNIVGHEGPVKYPSRTKRLDYEGEVAIVFGKKGKDIRASNLMNYVAGYTLFNDFSIRDSNLDRTQFLNFAFAKNFESAGSLGPYLTLKDEIEDPQAVDFKTRVNDEIRQNGNTRSMIRTFGEFVELLSSDIVINPGDILASGTCAGTAADSSPRDANGIEDPTLYLKPGDKVEVTSPKIGLLRNRIIPKN